VLVALALCCCVVFSMATKADDFDNPEDVKETEFDIDNLDPIDVVEYFGVDGIRQYLDWANDPNYTFTYYPEMAFASCTANGASGQCQDKSKQPCTGGQYYAGKCPGASNIQCCVASGAAPGPKPPGGAPPGNPAAPAAGWNRDNCAQVAQKWLAAKVKYDWRANGPDGYRADCSGFVSACWGFKAPGYTTASIPGQQISASGLQKCDALLRRGSPGHIALFWGWASSGKPLVIEECGHTASCCSSGYTCPGSCQQGGKCNEYCPGCPIQQRSWSGVGSYQPFRRNGW